MRQRYKVQAKSNPSTAFQAIQKNKYLLSHQVSRRQIPDLDNSQNEEPVNLVFDALHCEESSDVTYTDENSASLDEQRSCSPKEEPKSYYQIHLADKRLTINTIEELEDENDISTAPRKGKSIVAAEQKAKSLASTPVAVRLQSTVRLSSLQSGSDSRGMSPVLMERNSLAFRSIIPTHNVDGKNPFKRYEIQSYMTQQPDIRRQNTNTMSCKVLDFKKNTLNKLMTLEQKCKQ